MKNISFTAKLALIIVTLAMSLTACGTGNTGYTLTSTDQGNVSTAYNTAQCMSEAGSDFGQAVKCVAK